MSDITDWNVREVKTPVEYINSQLPSAGSRVISAFMSEVEGQSFTVPSLLEFCKNNAEKFGLEFRNIKEIGKLGEVVRGKRKIEYTAEEREKCKHKLPKEECRLCEITQQIQVDNLRKKIEKRFQDQEKERLMKEMSEENWREKRCVHGLGYLETCLSCNDLVKKELELEKNIDHPEYYNLGRIEVIDFIEDQKLGFHLGNVVKYVCREGKAKNKIERLEDLEKARWYLSRYIEREMYLDHKRSK